ncbi:MAG TPA: ATP-dependent DNA helicase RecG [Trueperaceae bacterium]
MASVGELRERLRRPLLVELRNGCEDSTVVGGLEKLVATVGKPFADINEVIRGYSELEPAERQQRVTRALELLEERGRQSAANGSGPQRSRSGGAGSSRPRQPRVADRSPGGAGARATGLEPALAAAPKAQAPASGFPADRLDSELDRSVLDLGAQAAKKLGALGITTYRNLLFHLPRRYEDRRSLPGFSALTDESQATVTGTVLSRKGSRSRRGMALLRASLEDATGEKLTAVWFNQPWLEKQIFPGQRLIVTGKVKVRGRQRELAVQHMEIDDDSESLSSGRIVAIYPSTQGLSQAYIRRAEYRLLSALATVPDHLPRSILERFDLVPFDTALREIHFPSSEAELGRATRRLKFDEFLFLELRVLLNRDADVEGKRIGAGEAVEAFEKALPFDFTTAQRSALDEILADMGSGRQMARLLQGDVGSGKTAVAAAAIAATAAAGYQAALMAPTEILARQHFINLRQYLFPLGISCELLLGTMTASQRRGARERLASGAAVLAVGTHALIQEGVEFRRLGLAVIDEEHRFGVEQRRKLLRSEPHVLVMSATPIPRSLALTYYGDLELSVIDQLPPGRKPVTTRLFDAKRRREVYHMVTDEIRKGRQAFLVTPLIEESDALEEIVSTTQMFEELQQLLPEDVRLEMLHGRMSGQEKDEVMERFRRHEFDLLVSTTVIEVGVDIPNATLMVIENAERFGLSQLHQLRGRVGRGEHESLCILVAGDRSRKTQKRLEVVVRSSDGFVIAEKDLELRGPGELRGTRQSGLPDLMLGDLVNDVDLIESSRDLAKRMLEADPHLNAPWAKRLKEELQRRTRAIGFRQVI